MERGQSHQRKCSPSGNQGWWPVLTRTKQSWQKRKRSSHLWGQQEKCQVSSTKKDESPISCQAWDTVRTSGLDRFSLIMPPFLQITSCKLGWYKIDELSYIKLKNFYSLKELWRSEKTNHQMGRDICNTYNQQRIRIQNIFKKLLKINSIKGGGAKCMNMHSERRKHELAKVKKTDNIKGCGALHPGGE